MAIHNTSTTNLGAYSVKEAALCRVHAGCPGNLLHRVPGPGRFELPGGSALPDGEETPSSCAILESLSSQRRSLSN